MKENAVTSLVFMSPSRVMVLKQSKIVLLAIFYQCQQKSKGVIAIYVYASESSRFALIENGVGYYAMTYSLEDISV